MDGDGLGDIVQSEHSFYLHNNGDGTFTKKNITATTDMPLSEYERKFSKNGNLIYYVIVQKMR